MLSPPESKLGKLLQQYVCARITRMDQIDIGLYDFDRHNALYYFVVNADEEIYLRYGGRDSESATTYLNLRSLELALEQGLEMHSAGQVPKVERPEALFPIDIQMMRSRTTDRGDCVECHLIADYQNLEREKLGELEPLRDLFRSPDIKRIGIHLDVPAGLRVKLADGAVANAGMQAGDFITHIAGKRVRTFGDLQYHYDQLPRDQQALTISVKRGKASIDLNVQLPQRWWYTDLAYRHWTVEPMVHFKTRPLSSERKEELGVPTEGFAAEIVERDRFLIDSKPPLKNGDIVLGVDGRFEDPIADLPELHIKLRHRAGSRVRLHIQRGDERFEVVLKTERQSFRKTVP